MDSCIYTRTRQFAMLRLGKTHKRVILKHQDIQNCDLKHNTFFTEVIISVLRQSDSLECALERSFKITIAMTHFNYLRSDDVPLISYTLHNGSLLENFDRCVDSNLNTSGHCVQKISRYVNGYIHCSTLHYVLPISDGDPWFHGALSGRLPRLLVKSAPVKKSFRRGCIIWQLSRQILGGISSISLSFVRIYYLNLPAEQKHTTWSLPLVIRHWWLFCIKFSNFK